MNHWAKAYRIEPQEFPEAKSPGQAARQFRDRFGKDPEIVVDPDLDTHHFLAWCPCGAALFLSGGNTRDAEGRYLCPPCGAKYRARATGQGNLSFLEERR